MKSVGYVKTGHVPFANPEQMGEVAKWVEKQVNMTIGGGMKKTWKLGSMGEVCDGICVRWGGRGRRPRWTGWSGWWFWSGRHACVQL